MTRHQLMRMENTIKMIYFGRTSRMMSEMSFQRSDFHEFVHLNYIKILKINPINLATNQKPKS